MGKKKKFRGIVIHCSDSAFGNAQSIEDYHKSKGWDDIGYHACISNGWIEDDIYVEFMDGEVEIGRDWDLNGAHAKGYNDYFGLLLIGIDKFTDKQFAKMLKVCSAMQKRDKFPISEIKGHTECKGTTKTCPNFEVSEVRRMLLAELEVFYG